MGFRRGLLSRGKTFQVRFAETWKAWVETKKPHGTKGAF